MAASGLFLNPAPLEDFNSCSIRHKSEPSCAVRHKSEPVCGTGVGGNRSGEQNPMHVFMVSVQHRQPCSDRIDAVDDTENRADSVLLLHHHRHSPNFVAANAEDVLFNEARCLLEVSVSIKGGDTVRSSVSIKGGDTVRSSSKVEQFRYGLQPSGHRHTSFQLSKYPIFFEPSHTLRELVDHVKLGLHAGHAPQLTSEGSGGVYFMKDECGLRNIAVFKPMDEEPMAVNNPRGFSLSNCGEGLRRGTRSGEGALREVAAYILDHPVAGPSHQIFKDEDRMDVEGFSGVPPTTMVKCYHKAFHYGSDYGRQRKAKTGSLQQFVHAVSSCEDMGSSKFPFEEVHKITVLDMRLANTDRNGGNILVCKNRDGTLKLVPIDHGYCFPDKFEDCSFEWLYWPQAQKPYSHATLEYIESLDAERDILLLQQCGWTLRPQLARILRVSTMLLKKGAKAGLTPFQIGSIMCRGGSLDAKSPVETMLENAEARHSLNSKESDFLNIMQGLLDEYITTLKQCQV